jgi:hypothetical protein
MMKPRIVILKGESPVGDGVKGATVTFTLGGCTKSCTSGDDGLAKLSPEPKDASPATTEDVMGWVKASKSNHGTARCRAKWVWRDAFDPEEVYKEATIILPTAIGLFQVAPVGGQ